MFQKTLEVLIMNNNNTNIIDAEAWKNQSMILSKALSNQTDFVDILKNKIKELTKRCEELEKENKELKHQMVNKNEVQTTNDDKVQTEEPEEITRIAFYDCQQFCYNILYIKGEVKLQDLPNKMQKDFEGYCTTHFAKCEPVLQDCIVEFGINLGYIDIEILCKKYDPVPYNKELCSVKQFIDAYNEFIKYYL